MRVIQSKRSARQLHRLLDFWNISLVIFNVLIYFFYVPTGITPSKRQIYKYPGSSPLRTPPPRPKLTFTEKELEEAIIGLNLPVKSRSYVHCSHPDSEFDCSQVVRAWRKISEYENHVKSADLNTTNYIITKHYFDGVGNRISIDAYVFLLALMTNKTMVVEGNYLKDGVAVSGGNAFDYCPSVFKQNDFFKELLQQERFQPVQYVDTFDYFWYVNMQAFLNTDKLVEVNRLMYTPTVYANHNYGRFVIENFGLHATYFISNWLIRFPPEHNKRAQALLARYPKSVRVFGVHLRFQFPGQFYSYSVETTMNAVRPFLKAKLREKKTIFAFASDSKEMEEAFRAEFGKYMIQTNATRKADFDHVSALSDIALIMHCDECLLSYRSTFSFCIATRMGKRCWFVEKEAPGVFQASNSQTAANSALFHYWDVNDWQTNRRFHHTFENEEYMRYYFKYLVL